MEPPGAAADEVTWVTDRVAITNFASAHDRATLAAHRVVAVLCLDRSLAGGPPSDRGLACVRVAHLTDGPNDERVFARAVTALGELLDAHGRVAVHCRAGRSRSVAVVAAYLAPARHLGADDVLAVVAGRRPSNVAPELVRLVRRYVAGDRTTP